MPLSVPANLEPPIDTTDVIGVVDTIGGRGRLKVTLMWNFFGDIDLHVTQPGGVEIYFDHNQDPDTGGFLDVDNRVGGSQSAENIFWENPPKGEYKVELVYFKDSGKQPSEGTCRVVVLEEGKDPKIFDVYMSQLNERKLVTTINIL
jgi:hypothetical protein